MNAPHPATFNDRRRFPRWVFVVLALIFGHMAILVAAMTLATGPGGPVIIESNQNAPTEGDAK